MSTRREFLKQTVAASALAAVRPLAARAQEKPRTPFVDGLSFFSPDPADVGRSGLAAFICDVSSGEQLKTTDGSVKFFRSFEACARSITRARRDLAENKVPNAFLATRGSEIADAFKDGRTAVFFQFQGCEPIGDHSPPEGRLTWRLTDTA